MPIRIYALAKELKIDNKILVDICTKAGITGKGSALASLTDEEAAKLKAYMSGSRASRGGAGGATAQRSQCRALGFTPGRLHRSCRNSRGKNPGPAPQDRQASGTEKKAAGKTGRGKTGRERRRREDITAKAKKPGKKPAETPPEEELKKPHDFRLPEEIKEAALSRPAEAPARHAEAPEAEKEKPQSR